MVLFEYKTLFSFFVKDGREGQVMFRKKQKLYICKKRKIRNGYTHQGVLQGRLKLTCGTPFLCAEHGANLAGASPATGFYRQV